MMRGSRLVVLTLLLMVVGAALIKGCGDAYDSDPTASVKNGAPRGLLAASLLLEGRGVRVVLRDRTDDAPLPPPASAAQATTIIVPPPERSAWTDEDAKQLIAVVAAGDRAVILCDDELLRNLRLKPLLDPIGVGCHSADVPIGDETLTHASGVLPAFQRALDVRGDGRAFAVEPAPAFIAWMAGPDPVVVKRPWGKGMFTVVGSATVFANDGIVKDDNAAFLLDEVGALPAQNGVIFDERHHHSASAKAFVDAAKRGTGPLTALFALALLLPVSLLSLSPRPGDPPRDDDRRTGAPAAEAQVRALAALLQRTKPSKASKPSPSKRR